MDAAPEVALHPNFRTIASHFRRHASLLIPALALLAVVPAAQVAAPAQTLSLRSAQIALGSGWQRPVATAVDAQGDLFVIDRDKGEIDEIAAVQGRMPASAQAPVIKFAALGASSNPVGLAVDLAGNLYVADQGAGTGSGAIRQIKATSIGVFPAAPVVSTLASNLSAPTAVAVDASGNIFFAQSVTGSSAVSEIAAGGSAAAVSIGTERTWNLPSAMALDANNNLLVAETGSQSIFSISMADGYQTVTQVASGFAAPSGVTVDAAGDLYVTDTSAATVTELVAVGGSISASSTTLQLGTGWSKPSGIAIDGFGNLYVADATVSKPIFELMTSGVSLGAVNLGAKSATATLLFSFSAGGITGAPAVLTTGSTGLDFTDLGTGSCTTGAGTAWNASSTCTVDVAFTPAVAGAQNGTVKISDANGNLLTTAFVSGLGLGPIAGFSPGAVSSLSVTGLGSMTLSGAGGPAFDAKSNLYIPDSANSRLVKLAAPVAGSATATVLTTGVSTPTSVAMDGAGNLYVAASGNSVVELSAAGALTTLSTGGLSFSNVGVAVDGAGNVYTADAANNRIVWFPAGGPAQVFFTGSALNKPYGLVSDSLGNLYVANYGGNNVVRISHGTATILSSTYLHHGAQVSYSNPMAIALDAVGNVYVGDTGNDQLVMIPNGTQNAFALSLNGNQVSLPAGVAVDRNGNLAAIDGGNSSIWLSAQQSGPALSFASTAVGATSSASSLNFLSMGNAALTLTPPTSGSNPAVSGNFALAGTSTCPSVAAGGTAPILAAGAFCELDLTFSPTGVGPLTGSLVLTDNASNSAQQTVALSGTGTTPTIAISPAAGTLTDGSKGVAYSQQFTASGGSGSYTYALAITSGSMPAGLTFNPSTGLLAGTPAASGTVTFTIVATDSSSAAEGGPFSSTAQAYSLTVSSPSIAVTPANLSAGTAGAAYANTTFAASGGVSPYTFAVSSGSLPAGMSLVAGVLTGTPTAAGTFNFTITVTDAAGSTGNHDYTLAIKGPSLGLAPGSGALADATAETAYSQQFTASGGTASYSYTVSSGTLPAGLTLSTSGLLSGSPATTGNFTFSVQVTDSTTGTGAPFTAARTYTLTVYPPIVTVIPEDSLLAPGTVGQTNYPLAFSAKGGNGTYTYSLTGGSLPTGMSLASGALVGAPKAAGTYTFTITATDSNLFTGKKTYTLTIGPPTITLTPVNPVLSEGVADAVYSSVTFGATSTNGGTAPYTYALTGGSLPAGMSLNAGVLSGTPTAIGTYYPVVTATDANHQTGSRTYALTISAPVVSVTTTSLLDAAAGLKYTQTLAASGGSGTYFFTASGLPAWLTLDANGTLHGTPQATDIGADHFIVTATDSNGFAASRSFTVNVYALAVTSSGTQNLGTAQVGGTATTGTVTFSFNGNFALASTPAVVLTQGASGLDFSRTGTGTCAAGIVYGGSTASCTVRVSFAPAYPGLRMGVVQLYDVNGNLLGSRMIYGVGQGAQANFLPSMESTVSSSVPLQTPQNLAVDATGALYVADSGKNQVVKIAQRTATVLMNAAGGLGNPASVAIDGAGNVFIADSIKNTIWEIPAGSATANPVVSATVNAPATALSAPQGVAVDGKGNLYIADPGNHRVLVATLTGAGYATPVLLTTATTLKTPVALAVSASGSVYIADATANMILIEPASGTQTVLGNQGSESTIATGVNAPVEVATDANGNVYIANSGANNVLKVAVNAQGGFSVPAAIATTATLTSSAGVAIDAAGNVYLSDGKAGVIYAENYSAPPSALAFATATGVGSLDTADGTKSFTVYNFGNDTLTFAAATGINNSSFLFNSQTQCNQQVDTLGANSSCTVAVDFKPTQVGNPLTGTLSLVYNNLASATTTQNVALSGIGVNSFVFSPVAGALTAGTVGAAYTQSIAVTSGGTAPYISYVVSTGALPPGIVLSTAGALSGTPTLAGDYAFTVTATDSKGDTGSAAYTLTIAADASSSTVVNSPTQQTVTFQFTNAATVAQVLVLTQGVTGLDFTDAGSGTCDPPSTSTNSYNSGNSCTVVVNFTAKYPGTRYGAVQLLDSNGNVLATSYISAVGTAPLALFSPGSYGSLSMKNLRSLGNQNGLSVPAGLAVDPAGNVYLADVLNNRVLKVTASGTTSVVSTGSIVLHYPTGVAIDGAGNLYIADNGDGQVVEVSRAGAASILDNGSLVITNNFSVAVDGSGNVYTTDLGSKQLSTPARIVKYPGGGTAQVLSIAGATLAYPTGLAVDGSGTLWITDNVSILAVKSGTATVLANGALSEPLSAPVVVTADGPGNLYISDGGNGRVLLLPAGSSDLGTSIPLNVGSLGTPSGTAIAGAGDLYVSDAARNTVLVSSQEKPSELDFDALVGVTSADQTMRLVNAGNSALNLPASASAANPAFTNSPSSFKLDSSTTCANLAAGGTTATMAAGNSCLLAIDFTATASGVVNDALTLTDNSNNVTGATQAVVLTGSTVTVAPNSGTPSTAYVLLAGTADTAYNNNLATTFTASGGTAPYCFSLSSGSLPKGMSISPDGILWGTPAVSGTFTFTVKASDSDGQAGTQLYSLTINPAPMVITPGAGALPAGTVLAPYGQVFTATGGTAPYSFTLTSGTLPKGLALSRGGSLTGIPGGAASNTSLVITATDSYGQTVSAAYTLTVNPPPVTVSPANGVLPAGTALIVYNQLFTATGGTMPYTFTVSAGALPAGLTLNAASGLLEGTPSAVGAFNFTVTATDSSSGGPFTGSRSYTLTLAAPAIVITPATLPNGAVGGAYSQQLSAAGGAGPYTFAVTSGALPAGLTLSANGLLAGTPASAGLDSFTITATDTATGATGQRSYQPSIFTAPATASPVAFTPAESVGSWSSTTATVAFNFHGSAIVNSFAVLTNGAANLEFKWAHSGTCTITEYNDGDSCTLDFYFKPLYPGQRVGAVELLDANGNVLGTGLISGTGTASLAAVAPGTESTLASSASSIPLHSPQGIALDASGNAYLADAAAHTVLKVTPAGTVAKLVDLTASSGKPVAVAIDGAGNLFVSDAANNTIWRVAPPYNGVPFAMVSNTINPPAAGLGSLGGLAIDAAGNLYFTAPAANLVYQMAQSSATGFATPAPIPTASTLNNPTAVAVDASGNVYVADTGNNRVIIEPPGGSTAASQETTIGAGLTAPAGVAVDLNGNVYIANTGANNVLKATLSGASYGAPTVVATTATLQSATGVAFDGRGNLYIADAAAKVLLEENYAAPRPLLFAKKTIVNTSDTTDGTISYTLFNAGNVALTAAAPGLNPATDFPLVAGSGTPADCTPSFSLAANGACNLSVTFQPTSVGVLRESIAITDNSLAQAGASQKISVTGTGLPTLQITWAAPATISYGTPLSATQLNASSGVVNGTFTYTPAAGTILNAGTPILSALFTPADLVDYSPATVTVPITVTQVATTTSLTTSVNPSLMAGSVTFTATVTPTAGVATGNVTFLDGTTVLGSAALTHGVAALATTTLTAGAHTISAVYGGDTNCITSTSATIAQQVIDFTLTAGGTTPGSNTQEISSFGGTAVYNLAILPTSGVSLPDTTTLTLTGLPQTFTAALAGAGWVQQSPTTWTLPANTPLATVSLTLSLNPVTGANHAPPAGWQRGGASLLLGLLLLPFAARLRQTGKRLSHLLPLVVLAGVIGISTVFSGCSAQFVPIPNSYNVVVTVQTGTVTHSTTLNLHVQ